MSLVRHSGAALQEYLHLSIFGIAQKAFVDFRGSVAKSQPRLSNIEGQHVTNRIQHIVLGHTFLFAILERLLCSTIMISIRLRRVDILENY